MSRPTRTLSSCLLVLLFVLSAGADADAHPDKSQREDERRGEAFPPSVDPRTSERWFESTDVGYVTSSGPSGYSIYEVRERAGWNPRPLATIGPQGGGDDTWVGYSCVTGDGAYVVAAVLPRGAVNNPAMRDRGAHVYSIETGTGEVRPLLSGASFKYHTLGCGLDHHAAVSRHLGQDQEVTESVLVDLRSGTIRARATVPGQVVAVVPVAEQLVGARGRSIVGLADGEGSELAVLPGRPYQLTPTPRGLDFLVYDGTDDVKIWSVEDIATDSPRRVGQGQLDVVSLSLGRDGRNVVVGASQLAGRSQLIRIPAPKEGSAQGASLQGRVALAKPTRGTDRESDQFIIARGSDGTTVDVLLSSEVGPVETRIPAGTFGGSAVTGASESIVSAAENPAVVQATLETAPSGEVPGGGFDADADGSGAAPGCAVPRNHLRRQVPQPNTAQIDWAIHLATDNALVGDSGTLRPANYLNMENLAGYDPSSDFPRRTLAGATSDVAVPPSFIQGTYAQESAWRQASLRAVPGVSGNPLVGDYYGSAGTLSKIDYPASDCGYGLSQVTHPMESGSTAYSYNGKRKVAVDYAENAAAGIQFMVDAWNDLYNDGVTMNDVNPTHLENWYFAAWAYNTGYHQSGEISDPDVYGLGWTNNPINADYPPGRGFFLRDSYADAERPADWPYQERVFGWMETPIKDRAGQPSYAQPNANVSGSRQLYIPPIDAFCDSTNDCDPSYDGPDDKDFCTRSDRRCWWHEPYDQGICQIGECHTSFWAYSADDPEPPYSDIYQPNCQSDLPAGTVIVDSNPNPELNVEGCSPAWSTSGEFRVELGTDTTSGDKLGVIDWHQLGNGFGGHTWFTKNRADPSDTSRINTGYWIPPDLDGVFTVQVHVPMSGASTSTARYLVHLGDGTTEERTIDQHLHENRWVALGNFKLRPGAYVELSSLTSEAGAYTANVAFDAVAFVPVSGTVERARVDTVAVFDRYQNLNASGDGVLRDRQATHEWARDLSADVLADQRCSVLIPADCVGDATHEAYLNWNADVESAGNGTGLAWDTETLPLTQADWLALPNPRPAATIDQSLTGNRLKWKVWNRIDVEYVAHPDTREIQPGSYVVHGHFETGDTHVPEFILDTFDALEADYQIAPPDMRYSAEDLNLYTHTSTSIAPAANGGILPGRQYRYYLAEPQIDGAVCVRSRSVGGGSIGWRPFLAQSYVRGEFAAWVERVRDANVNGVVPDTVRVAAESIWDNFLDSARFWPPDPTFGAPFMRAPAIWMQQDVKVCPTDVGPEIRPGAQYMADNSYMPDLYIYIDGEQAGRDAEPRTCERTATRVSRACAAQQGDFYDFAQLPGVQPNAWGPCYFIDYPDDGKTFYDRREGIPWSLSPLIPDETPHTVRLCDDPLDAYVEPN